MPRYPTHLLTLGFVLIFVALALLNQPSHPKASAAGPTPTIFVYLPLVSQSACAGSRVKDGGFEASTSGISNPFWQFATNVPRSIYDNSLIPSPNPTHSGSWKAWLGGDNLLQQALTQTVTIPSGASSLQVSFWWLVDTQELSPIGSDHTDVQILNASGSLLETLTHLFDTDWGTSWTQKTKTASQAYAGQTIQIAFVTTTDSTFLTNFFLDDINVTCN